MNDATSSFGKAQLPIETGLLFLGMLQVPNLSLAAILGLAAWVSFRWVHAPSVEHATALQWLLLLVFLATYYMTGTAYGFYTTGEALKYSGMIAASYAVGRAAAAERPAAQMWKLLALTAGSVVFVFLSVRTALESSRLLMIAERNAPSFWNRTTLYNAPGLGALGSLGMCLLPVALYVGSSGVPRLAAMTFRCVAALLAVLGTYVNLALQNRTPMIALAGAVIVTLVILPVVSRTLSGGRIITFLSIGILLPAALGSDTVIDYFTTHYGVNWRFREEGLETPRFEIWAAALRSLPDHLHGGRQLDLAGFMFAHDLWLDVAHDAGVLSVLLLLAFQLSHVPSIMRYIRSSGTPVLLVTVVGVGVSVLATFAVEPAMLFSSLFATSCFVLGLVSSSTVASQGRAGAIPV